jgi:hypothetical protein
VTENAVTEAEWLACAAPEQMLVLRRIKASKRKRRLFGCACCRRLWDLIPDERSRSAVATAEQFADGLVGEATLATARTEARSAYEEFSTGRPPFDRHYVTGACVCVASKNAGDAAKCWHGAASAMQMRRMTEAGQETPAFTSHPVMRETWEVERSLQADLLRDIFGNPFRPIVADASWRTSTVLALARGIYEDRAFDRMTILADALQDAGCDNEDVLNHCRDPKQVHVRGCWVVDLVLGKV